VHAFLLSIALLTVTLAAPVTRAQTNYEIQVYGSDLIDPARTMVELHSNFTIDGSKTIMDDVYSTNHAERRRSRSPMALVIGSSAVLTFSFP
jgi:hypothetical protein